MLKLIFILKSSFKTELKDVFYTYDSDGSGNIDIDGNEKKGLIFSN